MGTEPGWFVAKDFRGIPFQFRGLPMALKVFNPDSLNPATTAPADGLLERLEAAVESATTAGKASADVGAALKRLIHSPVTALLVKLTPNAADDAALELLKSLFPAA